MRKQKLRNRQDEHRLSRQSRVQNGHITALREYWPDPFAVPEWRRDFALRASK